MNETQAVERTVRIVNPSGLHARPAAQLVQMASRFVCEVQVGKDGVGREREEHYGGASVGRRGG